MQSASTFELLEPRRMLAGNVTATLNSAGELVLQGDNKANHLAVVADGSGYQLLSLDTAIQTSIPGAVPVPLGVLIPGVPRNLIANLGNGDDALLLAGTASGSDITIQTGNGNDEILIASAAVIAGSLNIDTGNGNDHVEFGEVEFFDATVNINLGKGDDTLELTEDAFVVLTTAHIDAGAGSDTIVNESFFAPASATIDLLHFENHLP